MRVHCARRYTRGWACLGVIGPALFLILYPATAWPWGCEGHQAVAMIAEKYMSAHARAKANKLLRTEPVDPALSRYCSSQGLDLMVDASTWADDLRSSRPETGPWHYIDIPRDAPRGAVSEFCPAPPGCVTNAIERQTELLRGRGIDAQTRADALRFIIHFVGDLHQPLHCVSNNDLGGNCMPINFFGSAPIERNPQSETYAPNLHAIWDSAIIQRMKGTEPVSQWAESLNQHYRSDVGQWENDGINLENWAWASHNLADTVAYAKLPVAVPVEKPLPTKGCSDDDHVSTRLLQLHEQVSQPYLDAVAPVISEQIVKAGVRLAMVLNQIWP